MIIPLSCIMNWKHDHTELKIDARRATLTTFYIDPLKLFPISVPSWMITRESTTISSYFQINAPFRGLSLSCSRETTFATRGNFYFPISTSFVFRIGATAVSRRYKSCYVQTRASYNQTIISYHFLLFLPACNNC